MRSYRGSLALSAWLCVGAAALAGCAETHEDPSVSVPATFTYTCCSSADVDPVVHPGDVLRLHWIVTPGPPAAPTSAVPVALSASLTGPYADVANLKVSVVGNGAPSPTMTASPVQTTDQAGGAPVTTIAIPPDAAPGLYNLTTVVESSGATLTGGHIIRIEPRATS